MYCSLDCGFHRLHHYQRAGNCYAFSRTKPNRGRTTRHLINVVDADGNGTIDLMSNGVTCFVLYLQLLSMFFAHHFIGKENFLVFRDMAKEKDKLHDEFAYTFSTSDANFVLGLMNFTQLSMTR